MTYQLVFDIADQIPLIALGVAATVAAILVIAAGLWMFDELLQAWPATVSLAVVLVILEAAIGQSPSKLFWLWPVGLMTVGELLRDRLPFVDLRRVPVGGLATAFATFALVFAALSGIGMVGAIGLTQQLRAGHAEVLEGTVIEFFEVAGGKNECFTVQSRRFCYSEGTNAPGFHRTRAFGGPIQPGSRIRIAAIGDSIVRLEIAAGH